MRNNQNIKNTATSARIPNAVETSAFIPKGLYPHQLEAIEIARRSISSMLKELVRTPHTKGAPIFRGGLVNHSTGSGKTVTSLGIVMEYLKMREMLQRLHSPNHAPGKQVRVQGPYICIVTLKSNVDQNGLQKYLKNLRTHYPEYARSLLPAHVYEQEASVQEKHLTSAFQQRVKYFSFIQFASCLGLYGKDKDGKNRDIKGDKDCLQMRKDWKKRGIVVIIDEAHELTKSDLRDWGKIKGDVTKNEYQAILRTKRFLLKHCGMGTKIREGSTPARPEQANPLLHVYALTATPGTSPQQVVDTINMVRPANMGIRTLDNWKKTPILHRFISFADLSGNKTLFAKVTDEEIVTPIHAEHYAMILHKLGKYREKHVDKKAFVKGCLEGNEKMPIEFRELEYKPYTEKDYLRQSKALQNYFTVTDADALYSCIHKAEGPVVFTKIAKLYHAYCKPWFAADPILKQRYGGLQGSVFPGGKLVVKLPPVSTGVPKAYCIAPKIMKVVHTAFTSPGKQFIYTSDTTTLRIISWLLQELYNMKNITEGVRSGVITNEILEGELGNIINAARGKKKKEYAEHPERVQHNNFMAVKGVSGLLRIQNFMSGIDMYKKNGDTGAWITEDVTPDKMKRNAHGQNCRIIVVTGELFTGVDINALRGVHIVEPFASHTSHAQARGRAARAGGHSFLPEANQKATVYTYKTRVSKESNSHSNDNRRGVNLWNWNSDTMKDGRKNGEPLFVKHIGRSHPTGRFTDAMAKKIKMGRQFLDGNARVKKNPRNVTHRIGGGNQMNWTGQILYPTPDDTLTLERMHGAHTREMESFNNSFINAVKKRH